jgi:site-specific DNA-methyltransferase (cytosine-N4-specific)
MSAEITSLTSHLFTDLTAPVSVEGLTAFYSTGLGSAYLGDSLDVLKRMPEGSVDLIMTSPPYALEFKKEYGNQSKDKYQEWFLGFARELHRVLKDDGSFVLNIAGSWNKGSPTKSLYQYKLLIALVEEVGFHLAQEFFWYNPAKMPVPAEWVTVRRVRVKDSVEHVWWLSKTPHPKANNRKVLKAYSKDMLRLNKRGLKNTQRPSGHIIKESFADVAHGGAIPPNVFEEEQQATDFMKFGNNAANDNYALACKERGMKRHPARFPNALPEFFINVLTNDQDLVMDPFAGSNTTGAVAERMNRKWLAVDCVEEYLEGSKFRFA